MSSCLKTFRQARVCGPLKELGYVLDDAHLADCFERFKELADRKKDVSDFDLRALVEIEQFEIPADYEFDTFVINSGNKMTATAVVKLQYKGKAIEEAATGDGPVDAAFNAVERCIGETFKLEDYVVRSVTGGQDAQGELSSSL